MAIHNRPNPNDYFSTSPQIDPDLGAKIDQELNALTSTVNSLDDENIDGDPKIAFNKIETEDMGDIYVPKVGGEMTGTLEHIFDGIWRIMRASGNARIREYRGTDGALWGIVYNTRWVETEWAGRDVSGICMAIKIEVDGVSFHYAPPAAGGVVPSWTQIFKANSSSELITNLLTVKNCVQWLNLPVLVAGDVVLDLNATERNTSSTDYTKLKETQIFRDGTLRIKFDLRNDPGGLNSYGRIYRNDVAVGTERITISATYVTFSEDISGWASGDLVQVYVKRAGSSQTYIQNLSLNVNNLIGVVPNGSF